MSGPLFNACDVTLEQSVGPMPSMRSTLAGWCVALGLSRVVTKFVGTRTEQVEVPVEGSGTWQPFSAQQLQLKPEGERAWRWFMIHTTTDIGLAPSDRITRAGSKFLVMEKLDYSVNGYFEYHVVDATDLKGGGP